MTATQKRNTVKELYKSILGRNKYSQAKRDYCFTKYKDGKYYSDCSSSVSYCYKKAGYSFGILNTVGMYNSTKMTDVPVIIKSGQIQNPEVLRVGDMLLFAGNDSGRKYAGYVGHVEMVYAISGDTVTLAGHGSGTPSTKNMKTYCKNRYYTKASTALGHRGLIRVRRFIQDDVEIIDLDPLRVLIKGGNCYIRTKANKNSKAIGVAKRDTFLEYGGEVAENGWIKVRYKGQDAWVSGKYGRLYYA